MAKRKVKLKRGNEKKFIVISKEDQIETWTTLTNLCKCHEDFSYHFLKQKKFPFEYKGWKFKKQILNSCS